MPPASSGPAARVLDVSEEGQELLALLFPQLAALRVHRIEDTGDAVVITASCTASSGSCPACGSVSARVHGGYSRTVAGGAAGGRPVLIILRVLRFLCTCQSCPKGTFALQDRQLIRRARSPRSNREITVTLLRENGSGDPYYHPADGAPDDPADWYFRLPVSFWTKGLDSALTMPGLAMLLTVAREKPWSSFPSERAPEWYGWSPDTTERGLRELVDSGLCERRAAYRRTPLSPTGHTLAYQYRLKSWLRPKAGERPAKAAS